MTDTDVLDLSGLTDRGIRDLQTLIKSRQFDSWAEQVARVGNCTHPVKLTGASHTVDTRTGEILSTYSSDSEFGGVTRIACGNRRASVCPACSRRYAADTWHLIKAGAAGGKGIPETVAAHPLVFATATAPSFGPVHTEHRNGAACRPRRQKNVCAHGRPSWCGKTHAPGDSQLGQPLCSDCYDYTAHVIWQWHAPELWRRFTIALNRAVSKHLDVKPSHLKDVASIQFAKVGEYQRRGVIHFHALVRLDGPKTPDGITTPPAGLNADTLADLVRQTFHQVAVTAAPIDANDIDRRLGFGRQIDARPVTTTTHDDEALTSEAVAGYIAKYATKTIDDPDSHDRASAHHRRLRVTVRALADRAHRRDPSDDNPYALLGKWDHMLGFRGHFSSKSRRYSTTLGRLRSARRRWQRLAAKARSREELLELLDTDDGDDDTTLVIGHWKYAGQGWANEGQTALAAAAAARAREHQRQRATQINHVRDDRGDSRWNSS